VNGWEAETEASWHLAAVREFRSVLLTHTLFCTLRSTRYDRSMEPLVLLRSPQRSLIYHVVKLQQADVSSSCVRPTCGVPAAAGPATCGRHAGKGQCATRGLQLHRLVLTLEEHHRF